MHLYGINEIKTIDITESIESLAKTLIMDNIFNTVFVLESDGYLQGIVTRGDF